MNPVYLSEWQDTLEIDISIMLIPFNENSQDPTNENGLDSEIRIPKDATEYSFTTQMGCIFIPKLDKRLLIFKP